MSLANDLSLSEFHTCNPWPPDGRSRTSVCHCSCVEMSRAITSSGEDRKEDEEVKDGWSVRRANTSPVISIRKAVGWLHSKCTRPPCPQSWNLIAEKKERNRDSIWKRFPTGCSTYLCVLLSVCLWEHKCMVWTRFVEKKKLKVWCSYIMDGVQQPHRLFCEKVWHKRKKNEWSGKSTALKDADRITTMSTWPPALSPAD